MTNPLSQWQSILKRLHFGQALDEEDRAYLMRVASGLLKGADPRSALEMDQGKGRGSAFRKHQQELEDHWLRINANRYHESGMTWEEVAEELSPHYRAITTKALLNRIHKLNRNAAKVLLEREK